MGVLKLLRSHHFRGFNKPNNLLLHYKIIDTNASPTLYSSIFQRPLSGSTLFQSKDDTNKSSELNKPLGVLFKEAVGLRKKPDENENEEENGEAAELKKRLKDLENEVKVLNESNLGESGIDTESMKKIKLSDEVSKNESTVKLSKLFSYDSRKDLSGKPAGIDRVDKVSEDDIVVQKLSALFPPEPMNKNRTRKPAGIDRVDKVSEDDIVVQRLSALFPPEPVNKNRTRKEETVVCKELPPNMIVFARHLFEKGYLKNANFLFKYTFDATRFEDNYSRAFLTCAAQKFGKDHQEISKWISASDVKKIALFGCPSLSKKPLMAAKALRIFFSIPEDTVCSKCVLKESCKFVNQSIWKGEGKKWRLDLSALMNVLTLYAMEEVHPELVVPDEIKTVVTRLLEEVIKLSQTVS